MNGEKEFYNSAQLAIINLMKANDIEEIILPSDKFAYDHIKIVGNILYFKSLTNDWRPLHTFPIAIINLMSLVYNEIETAITYNTIKNKKLICKQPDKTV
jgi:hypothetical protein